MSIGQTWLHRQNFLLAKLPSVLLSVSRRRIEIIQTMASSTLRLVPLRSQMVNESALESVEQLAATASEGDLEMVKVSVRALEKASDINLFNMKGLTPLSLAAYFGHEEVISYLLQHNANVNQPDFYGMTAISYASEKGHTSVVKALIKAGADVDWMDVNNEGLSALHIASCKGQTEVIEVLIEGGANVNAQDHNGVSVLHCAVGNGHQDVVEYLVKAGAKVNAEGSVTNRTPIYLAIDINSMPIGKLLLEHRARTNVKDSFGLTPLTAACLQGKEEIAELLLAARANVNIPDNKNFLPIHYIARSGKYNLLCKLLDAGSRIDVLNDHFESPLHLAVRMQHIDIIRELIKRGCNPNFCEPYSHVTALHVAVNTYNDTNMFEEVLKLLLEGGCHLNSRAFTSLESPIYRAINLNKEAIAMELLRYGADINLDCPFDVTLLQKACQKDHYDLVEAMLHDNLDWSREGWLQLDKYSCGYADLSLLADYKEDVPLTLHNKIDLYFHILEYQHNPASLMRNCRKVIRSVMKETLYPKICGLELPPRLRDFLLFKII